MWLTHVHTTLASLRSASVTFFFKLTSLQIRTASYNVAVAGSILMYDRMVKSGQLAFGAEGARHRDPSQVVLEVPEITQLFGEKTSS